MSGRLYVVLWDRIVDVQNAPIWNYILPKSTRHILCIHAYKELELVVSGLFAVARTDPSLYIETLNIFLQSSDPISEYTTSQIPNTVSIDEPQVVRSNIVKKSSTTRDIYIVLLFFRNTIRL